MPLSLDILIIPKACLDQGQGDEAEDIIDLYEERGKLENVAQDIEKKNRDKLAELEKGILMKKKKMKEFKEKMKFRDIIKSKIFFQNQIIQKIYLTKL